MIGKITGIVDLIEKDHIIVDVNGVGYLLFVSHRIGENLSIGEKCSLYTETIVREDSISLYGFSTIYDKYIFNELTTVKGVGSKVAVSILGAFEVNEILSILANQDKSAFTKVAGIGPKLSERIISELKDKNFVKNAHIENKVIAKKANRFDIQEDARSALMNLGYNKTEAANIVQQLFSENDKLTLSELIKEALKELAR